MATKVGAVLLIIADTFLMALGQLFLKLGMNNFNINTLFLNYYLILGLFLYGLSAIIFVIALKSGELSVLYPIFAATYIWVTLLSLYVLNESINELRWIGVIVIGIGVGFIGTGGRK